MGKTMSHRICAAVFFGTIFAPSFVQAQEIGIPACDDFIAKYVACVADKIPAAAQTEFQNALVQWRTEWKKLAADSNNRTLLTHLVSMFA
jgi:hypothetical protein